MSAVGTLDASVAIEVKALFEQRCVALLQWATHTLKSSKSITVDWGEENITANIFVLIHNSQQAIDYDIHPECEHPFFSQDILDNKMDAKAAKRIDLVFQHNWSGRRFSFYVEAKNLIESDVLKSGRKRKTKASTLLNRYISTGIDHYKSAYYPHGCMLGYVLNGTIAGVVTALNAILKNNGRSDEALCNPTGTLPWMCYQSNHDNLQINHYMFDFT